MLNPLALCLFTLYVNLILNLNFLGKIMKKILLAIATSAAVLAAVPALAASPQTATFNVTVTLTPECTFGTTNPFAIADLAFPGYTAFGAAVSATTTASLKCTRGTAVGAQAVFTGPVGFVPGAAVSASAAIGPSAGGVVNGLQYLITSTATFNAGTAPTATVLDLLTDADRTAYAISGSIPAGQAGSTTVGTAQALTLTVTY